MNPKIKWLRDKIGLLDMQGMIVSNPVNIKYLTNIDAEGVLLITRKENIFITDGRYIEVANSTVTIDDEIIVCNIKDISKDDYENFFNYCENVGFEENYITYAEYKEYIHKYKINNFEETESIIEKQRMIKDEEEIRNLRKACSITDDCFDHLKEFIKIGFNIGIDGPITFKNNKKEIDIKEAIENRKGLYKRINLKEIMEKAGVESRINQFMLKRKINPVILEAINENEKMTEEYIYSLIEKKEFPFEYKHDLENSNLSFKDMALMNRVALKESKIDGNEVIGAKKLYTIKSFFGKIKNKALAKFNKKEEPKMINEKNEKQEDTKNRKERFHEFIEYTPEEQKVNDIELKQKNKYNEAYEKLTDEQKAKLATMDVSNIQRLGFDYNTAVALREMKNNEDKKVTQESTTKEDKKVTQESTTKEDDESQR